VANAVRRGWSAAAANLPSILALQAAMAAIVAAYYLWPQGSAALSTYAQWQAQGGPLGNGLALGIAGGVLSQLSYVYFQKKGRWQRANVESVAFNFIIFFISGCIVFEFYRMQAVWWGQGTSLSVIVPKVLVDQFVYTVVFSAPYYALLTRWHALGYSGARLGRELKGDFLTERFLPMLVMNWMFWIPAISFVYAMPTVLEAPLAVFASAIWALLISAIGSQEPSLPTTRDSVAATVTPLLAEPAE
jgi:hypothetical protein